MALMLKVSHSLPYFILTAGETEAPCCDMSEAHDVFAGNSRFHTGVLSPPSHVLRVSCFPHFCRSASVARRGAGERQWRKMRALGLVVVYSWPREISVRAIYCKIFPISGVSHGYRALMLGCHWSLVLLPDVHTPHPPPPPSILGNLGLWHYPAIISE